MGEEAKKIESAPVSVDVEKIMEGIRQDIAKKQYTPEQMAHFATLKNADGVSGDVYSPEENARRMEEIHKYAINPITFPVTGNPLKVFVQKVLRRLSLFVVFPALQYQNKYNKSVEAYLELLEKRLEDQEKEIEALKKKLGEKE